MKKAIKLIIKKTNGNGKVNKKIILKCAYCESSQTYIIKNKNILYCRKCGKESKI